AGSTGAGSTGVGLATGATAIGYCSCLGEYLIPTPIRDAFPFQETSVAMLVTPTAKRNFGSHNSVMRPLIGFVNRTLPTIDHSMLAALGIVALVSLRIRRPFSNVPTSSGSIIVSFCENVFVSTYPACPPNCSVSAGVGLYPTSGSRPTDERLASTVCSNFA